MATPITKRDVALGIILSIVTCGIYTIYWMAVLTEDIRKASQDDSMPSGGIAILLTIVTCGIYGYYWAYKMGKGLQAAHRHAGDKDASDNSVLYLVLEIFELLIVNLAIMQNDLNSLADMQEAKAVKSSNGK